MSAATLKTDGFDVRIRGDPFDSGIRFPFSFGGGSGKDDPRLFDGTEEAGCYAGVRLMKGKGGLMRKSAVVLAAILAMSAVLFGCAAQSSGDADSAGQETVFEETLSPNKEYAATEDDIVYDTVRVTQDGSGVATVAAESNSAFFDPVSYEVECGGDLTAEDVSVEWTTLMGSAEPSEEDQLAVAVVSVRTVDGGTDVRKVNFVSGALEIIAEAVSEA